MKHDPTIPKPRDVRGELRDEVDRVTLAALTFIAARWIDLLATLGVSRTPEQFERLTAAAFERAGRQRR